METYIVRVNGVAYEVEVEKKGATSQAAPASSSAGAAPAPAAPAPAAPAPQAAGAGTPVTVGTSGKVLQLSAKPGDSVHAGDPVIIVEAMKMEIPVVAPADGTVQEITVKEGETVQSGQTVAILG